MYTITGTLEKIIFSNMENAYIVAELLVEEEQKSITIVGNLLSVNIGETLRVTGEWKTHNKFGRQLNVKEYKSITPNTITGIKKYLGSGLIKGIGPKTAEKIVNYYKKDTLEIIDNHPAKLRKVPGIGKVTVDRIVDAWVEQKEIRDVMIFLQSYNISSAYSVKIYKKYGRDSIEIVRNNPYRLSTDIFGIGFMIADKIAENLGIPKNSIIRAKAGISFVLRKASLSGHVFLYYKELLQQVVKQLEIDKKLADDALTELENSKEIIIEPDNGNKCVYVNYLYNAETYCAKRVSSFIEKSKLDLNMGFENEIEQIKNALNIELSAGQKKAIETVLNEKITIITGGPGTGKTTIINSIIHLLKKRNLKITLCAPTGRAAKRMTESTGFPAKTIHRLLEFNPHKNRFEKNFNNPVIADILVVDESSMIDVQLFSSLLDAIKQNTKLIFIGDVDQLPSVGSGNVLKDLINCDNIAVVYLKEIFRQQEHSRIIINSHKINNGEVPVTDNNIKSDFFFIETDNPEEAAEIVSEIYTKRIPNKFGFNPYTDIQVLAPMNKGIAGVNNLNAVLQKELNKSKDELYRGSRMFKTGDKVMQIKNNYDKNVFNGDMGIIERIDGFDQKVYVNYNGLTVSYDFINLDEITLAYAISIHKSQGSEFPCVIIPLLTSHYIMLQRNLLYTAVTRGKQMVNIVGSKKALEMAISNNKIAKRNSMLAKRIMNYF